MRYRDLARGRPCFPFSPESGCRGPGIRVDNRQETNCPGVYAAGMRRDEDLVYEDRRSCPLAAGVDRGGWPPEHGRIPAVYPGALPGTSRVFGFDLTAVAAAMRVRRERSETGRATQDRPRPGHPQGLIFIGEAQNEGLYTGLIKSGPMSLLCDSS